jgi:homocitrate synthase NifV
MAGLEFGPADAAAIAVLLRRIGIDIVEVGIMSNMTSADVPLIAAVHEAVGPENSLTLVMVRQQQQVVEALAGAQRLGCRSVMLSLPTSIEHAQLKLGTQNLRYLIKLARIAIAEAKDRGFHVTFSGEDAARAEKDRLQEYVTAGFNEGADRFRLAETVSSLTPWKCAEIVSGLSAIDHSKEIEVHCHNMLGMAVANSLASYEAGAAWVSATVGGIGERGGNTPLAELLCALRVVYQDQRYQLSHLTALSAEVERRAALNPPFTPGPVTPYAYAYELPGQLANPSAYESIAPEELGNKRSLRVRTRITPVLLRWALGDSHPDINTDAFLTWLCENQERSGHLLLDQPALQRMADEFAVPVN